MQIAVFLLFIKMLVLTIWMFRFWIKKSNKKLIELLEDGDSQEVQEVEEAQEQKV
jgi:hypothetical protein